MLPQLSNPQSGTSAYDKFLCALDPDGVLAAGRYELLLKALMLFFDANQCDSSEDLAHEVIDRIVKKIDNGFELTGAPQNYCFGIAKMVLHEYRRSHASLLKRRVSLEAIPLSEHPSHDAAETQLRESAEQEKRLACMEKCLQGLRPEERELITRYCQDEKSLKIAGRKNVMIERDGTRNALRLRVFRIREKLKKCRRKCLAQSISEKRKPL